MQFKLLTLALLGAALANPIDLEVREPADLDIRTAADVCPSEINSLPACCRTDVGGVAALDCQTNVPTGSPKEFRQFCQKLSKTPLCCITTLLGVGVSCVDPAQ